LGGKRVFYRKLRERHDFSMSSLTFASVLALLLSAPAAEALAIARGPMPVGAPQHLRRPMPVASRAVPAQMFGPGGGGFLNLGTPEMFVIGAVAWALLGPKELYRLSREAGSFLGEWQQLGRSAQKTFQDAIDSEMEDDGKPADPNSPSSVAARFRAEANEFAAKMQSAGKPAELAAAAAAASTTQGPPTPVMDVP